jgi:hypothetical protein
LVLSNARENLDDISKMRPLMQDAPPHPRSAASSKKPFFSIFLHQCRLNRAIECCDRVVKLQFCLYQFVEFPSTSFNRLRLRCFLSIRIGLDALQ